MEANTELEKKESNNQGGQKEAVRGVQASPARNQLDRVRDKRTVAKYGEFNAQTKARVADLNRSNLSGIPERIKPTGFWQHQAQAAGQSSGILAWGKGFLAASHSRFDVAKAGYHAPLLRQSLILQGIRAHFTETLPTQLPYYSVDDKTGIPRCVIDEIQLEALVLRETGFRDDLIREKITSMLKRIVRFQQDNKLPRIDSPVQQVAMDLREQLRGLAAKSDTMEAWDQLIELTSYLKLLTANAYRLKDTPGIEALSVLLQDLTEEIEGTVEQRQQYSSDIDVHSNEPKPLALLFSRQIGHQLAGETLAEKNSAINSMLRRSLGILAPYFLSMKKGFDIHAYLKPGHKEELAFAGTPIGELFSLLNHVTKAAVSKTAYAKIPGTTFNIFTGNSLHSLCLIRDPQAASFSGEEARAKCLLMLEPAPYADVFGSKKSPGAVSLAYPKRQRQNYQIPLPKELHNLAPPAGTKQGKQADIDLPEAFKEFALAAVGASVKGKDGFELDPVKLDAAIKKDYIQLHAFLRENPRLAKAHNGKFAQLIYTPGFFLLVDPANQEIHAIRGKVASQQDWVQLQCHKVGVRSRAPVDSINGHLVSMSSNIVERLSNLVNLFGSICDFSSLSDMSQAKADMFRYNGACVAVQASTELMQGMEKENQVAQLVIEQLQKLAVDVEVVLEAQTRAGKACTSSVQSIRALTQSLSSLATDLGKVSQYNEAISDRIADLVPIAQAVFRETLHDFQQEVNSAERTTAATFGQEHVTSMTRESSLSPAFAQPALLPTDSPPPAYTPLVGAEPSAPPKDAPAETVLMAKPLSRPAPILANRTRGLPSTVVEVSTAGLSATQAAAVSSSAVSAVDSEATPQYQPLEDQPAETPVAAHKVTDYKIPPPTKSKFYTYIRNTCVLTGAIMLLVGSLAAAGALPGIATFFAASAVPLMLAGAGVFFVTLFFKPEKDTTFASIKRWAARMSVGVFALSIVALVGSLPALTAGLAAAAAPLVVVGLLLLAVSAFSEGMARRDHSVKEAVYDLEVGIQDKLLDNVSVAQIKEALGYSGVRQHFSQETQDKLQESAPGQSEADVRVAIPV